METLTLSQKPHKRATGDEPGSMPRVSYAGDILLISLVNSEE